MRGAERMCSLIRAIGSIAIAGALSAPLFAVTPTPTRTRTPTRTPTRTRIPTRTPTITRTPTPTITRTPTVTPTFPVVCETPVYKGNDLVEVTVRYAHEPTETPGQLYEKVLGPLHFEDDAQLVVRAEGHPTECEWRFTIIFKDSFDSGTTAAWGEP